MNHEVEKVLVKIRSDSNFKQSQKIMNWMRQPADKELAMRLVVKLCMSFMMACLPGCFDSARYQDVSMESTPKTIKSSNASAGALGTELSGDLASVGTELSGSDLFLGLFSDHDKDGNGLADKSLSLAQNPSTLSMNFRYATSFQKKTVKVVTEKTPLDFFIMLDSSGSMSSSIHGARNNITTFINSLKASYTPRVTLMHFQDHPTVYSFGPSNDPQALRGFLGGIAVRGGSCEPANVAIGMALDAIIATRKLQGGMDRYYVLILITDEPYHCPTSPTLTDLAARFNQLAYPERIKLFASLGNPSTISSYTALFKTSLTSVPEAQRGRMDISYPFSDQSMIHEIVPEVERLIEGASVDLTCVLQKVSFRPLTSDLSGEIYDFPASQLKKDSGDGAGAIGRLDNLLKSNDPTKLRSGKLEGMAKYCCVNQSALTFDSQNLPQASRCERTRVKKITFSFDP